MKKIIIAILILINVKSLGQIDSLKLKTSVSLQVRDWLYLNSFLANNEEFENVYDGMKIQLRAGGSPTMTTVVTVDSIRQGQIISLAKILKHGAYGVVVFPYSRINNALRSNAYLTQKIDEMDAAYTTQYNERVQFELNKLRALK